MSLICYFFDGCKYSFFQFGICHVGEWNVTFIFDSNLSFRVIGSWWKSKDNRSEIDSVTLKLEKKQAVKFIKDIWIAVIGL